MNRTAAEKLGIKAFDAAEHSDEDCAAYLQACLEQTPDDAAVFAKALGDIARARGMMQLAKDTGLTREGLYKALGNPTNFYLTCDKANKWLFPVAGAAKNNARTTNTYTKHLT